MSPLLIIRVYLLVLLLGCNNGIVSPADLQQRIRDITQHPWWKHPYYLPSHQYARTLAVSGDTSRLDAFVSKLVSGGEGCMCDPCMRNAGNDAEFVGQK